MPPRADPEVAEDRIEKHEQGRVRSTHAGNGRRLGRRRRIEDFHCVEGFGRLRCLCGPGTKELFRRCNGPEPRIDELRLPHELCGEGSVKNLLCVLQTDGPGEALREKIEGVVNDAAVQVHPAVVLGRVDELAHLRGARNIGNADDRRGICHVS